MPMAIESENRRINSQIGNQFNGFNLRKVFISYFFSPYIFVVVAVGGDFDWTFGNAIVWKLWHNVTQNENSFIAADENGSLHIETAQVSTVGRRWNQNTEQEMNEIRKAKMNNSNNNNSNNRLWLLPIESWQLLKPRSILIVHNKIESYCLML